MLIEDFVYNNKRLSDYNCVLCHITDDGDTKTISIGSNINFNTVYIPSNHKFKLMSTNYTEAYTAIFQICKFNCNDSGDNYFTLEETASIMRWLNQKVYRKFKLISADGEYGNIYFMGSFNVKKITLESNTIGFELTLQTDAPFGYYEDVEFELNFPTGEESIEVYDLSDEVGYIYPQVTIECLSDGDLKIYNSKDEEGTVIKNCVNGEVINLDGENKIILSNKPHERLYNDFNYNHIRISNKDDGMPDDLLNIFSVSMPCNITIKYFPICKVGLV